MIDSLHIIGSRQLGGAERFFSRLVSALNKQGHDAVAMIRPGSPLRSILGEEIRRVHTPMRNGWDIFSLFSIRRFIQSEAPRIVQTYMGRATRLTRVSRHSPSIHVARLGGYYKIKGYYEHAHAWIGNTKGLCDYLIKNGMPSDRVYCIGNFVEVHRPIAGQEIQDLRQSLSLPDDAIILFTLGRFNYQKGYEDLLKAFSLLPNRIESRPVYLVIAGDGPLGAALRSQANHLHIQNRTVWLGWQDDPSPYYQMADIFVCSSRYETLGNVILEAWSHRLPVIATDAPGPMELIKDRENGIIAFRRDPEDIARAMHEVIREGGQFWRYLAANAMKTLLASHTKEKILTMYLTMYDELEKKKY
jgi:glycosyltransferase involved in cell wall biosynthesis